MEALKDLANNSVTNGQAILDALPSTMLAVLANKERLVAKLQEVASSRLRAAEAGSDVDALEHAIERGQAVRLAADVLQRAGIDTAGRHQRRDVAEGEARIAWAEPHGSAKRVLLPDHL